MRKLRKAKWLAAGGGIFSLATLLALSFSLPGNPSLETARLSHASSKLFHAATSPLLQAASSRNESKVNVVKHYGELPLAFEPNAIDPGSPAKFLARGDGYALFLARNEAVLELRGPSNVPAVLRMQLAGANSAPAFTPLEMLPGKSNYFIGNDPKGWHTNIAQYRKVLESDIYHGVNLVYYGAQGRLEYDFDVAPGADPAEIRLAFQGAENLRIDAQGELVAHTAAGDVRLRKPVAFQEIAGTRKPIAVSYSLDGKNNVTFELAEYDSRAPLVIDPVLSYSTYLGGSNIDSSNAIAVAPDNTAFIAGSTFSADFPTAHPLQANDGGGPDFPQDAFVSKISADGSTLLYSTYLGGENQDAANGIAVDNFGDAFVTGFTLSPHFPILTGSFETLCGGDGECGAKFTGGPIVSNAFVTKLNPAGSALLYSTFYGQFQNVKGNAIAVDSNGNAYITGSTSANFSTVALFPITPTAFQSAFCNSCASTANPTVNAFVAVLDATGTSALYSSYLGGEVEDVGYGIAVDSSANAYVTGLTYSTAFPVTAGALQSTYGGSGDAFVTKVNTLGTSTTSLVFSTYLGGVGLDQGNAIALDSAGNPYIAGLTNSAAFGFTPAGTVQPAYAGEGDAFVTKLTSAGALSYFTYLGGTHADSATGIAVDSGNNVYVTGTTASVDFPTAGAVFQPAYGGGNTDSFVAKLGPAGATLVYSSYLGGTNAELATGIAVDTTGSAYVTGQTCSDDFPLADPLQAVPGGNCDAYISKVSILSGFAFNPAGLVFPAQSLNTTSQSQTVTVTNGDVAQTISGIALTGTNAGDFTETNTCGSSLAVGGTCTITVSFTPTGLGVRLASLVVTDSAPGSPQILNLTGNTSTVTLSTSILTFGSQAIGTVSAPQDVTVTNSGTTPLTFSSIVASGDFFEADNCTRASLQPGSNCLLEVEFSPSAAINSIGTITITDNGSGSPQVILATGTGIVGPLFQITSLTAAPSVPAGQTATFDLSVTTPVGYTLPVGLSCSAPATITCTIAPPTVTPTTTPTLAAVLTVGTAVRTAVPPSTGIKIDPASFLRQFNTTWLLWLAVALMILTAASLRRRPVTAAFGFAVVLLLASVACGGGASGVPAGTAAGTYQVTVTGKSGSNTVPMNLTLNVK